MKINRSKWIKADIKSQPMVETFNLSLNHFYGNFAVLRT